MEPRTRPASKSPAKTISHYFSPSKSGNAAPLSIFRREVNPNNDILGASPKRVQFDSIKAIEKKRKRQESASNLVINKRPKAAQHNTNLTAQWTLDFGQREEIECPDCHMLYWSGNLPEEEAHRLYHQTVTKPVKIRPWKKMQIVYKDPADDAGVMVLAVSQNSQDFQRDFITAALELADKQLCYTGGDSYTANPTEKVYLYLNKLKIVGIVRVEEISIAHKLLDQSTEINSSQDSNGLNTSVSSASVTTSASSYDDVIVCSKVIEKASLGISRVWVWSGERRKGIASILIDVARTNFCFGRVIPKSECAMTQPTIDGRRFAAGYFGTKQFLVYDQNENLIKLDPKK